MARARYHHGDLRRSLLDAATALLRTEGASELSLRGVAAAAGVSHQAPYHHFASKDGLLAALAAEAFVELSAAMREGASGDARARLVALGAGYARFAVGDPERFRVMFGPILGRKNEHPELLAAAGESLAILEQAVAAASEGAPPAAIAEATIASWSLIHGYATLVVDGALDAIPEASARSPEAMARALGELLARAITSGPRRPTSSGARSRSRR